MSKPAKPTVALAKEGSSAKVKAPPGYNQTEVGVIPEEWEVRVLGSVCDIVAGRDLVKEDYSQINDYLYRYPIYANAATTDGLYGYSKAYQYESDRITVTGRGAGVGKAVYRNTPFCAIGRLLVLSPKCPCDLRFVTEYLNNFVAFSIESTGVPQLTSPQISRYLIPFPRPTEQRAIATALSDVDGLLGGLDRLIAKKRDLKLATMQQLLTGQTRLPGCRGDWEVKTFGELFNFSGGCSASRDELSSEGHCYLHYGDIHGATKTTIDVRADYQNIPKLDIPIKRVSPKSLLEDGDVVFVDASEDDEGTSKHVVVVNKEKRPFISGLHTIVAKSKTDDLAHEYRRYCFQTAAIRQQFLFYAVGTKVSGISKTNIAKLTMPVPRVREQIAIAEVLTDMDAELAVLELRREKTRALKQAMMQELLTGKTRLEYH